MERDYSRETKLCSNKCHSWPSYIVKLSIAIVSPRTILTTVLISLDLSVNHSILLNRLLTSFDITGSALYLV